MNRKALGLLIESIEKAHQARIRAIRARQCFEELLSVSSRHRERIHSRRCTGNESSPHITREASDQHPPAPTNGHEFLGANPSGGRRARSPPVGNGYLGTQGNRDDTASKSMRAPRREEPSRGVTAQIAVPKATRNPAITNAPSVTKDVVIEPVGTATQGTQPIVPKMPAKLAIAPSLGPSAGSTLARAVTVSCAHWSSHRPVCHAPRPYCHRLPEIPGILPQPCQPH